jgi:hypothetical protein
LLRFAKEIMVGCALAAALFAVFALFGPPILLRHFSTSAPDADKYVLATGTALLSIVTTVIPPIITLVLGFYFGKKGSGGD